jgi:DNA-binding transcriptional LysR family regulator
MTFSQLEIFVLVAQLKSFTLTANRLGISQSAVSHAVKNLEEKWQVKLLERQQQHVELTSIGTKLHEHAQRILNTANHMDQLATEIKGLQQGQLKIGSFGSSSSLHLLPELLNAFRKKYPDIEIFVEEGTDEQVAEWIKTRQVDVGFAVCPKQDLDTFPLIEDIFVALIPESYPIALEQQVSLKALADYPFIMTRAGSQTHVERLLKQQQVTPKIQYQLSQLLTILNMVNLQEGVSIVADMAISKVLLAAHPRVVKRPLTPNTRRQIALAVANQNAMSPATKAFIQLAQEMYYFPK